MMQTKKTVLSFFIWVLSLLVIGGLYATVSYAVALTLCGGQSVYAILSASAFALFFIVLYFLSKAFLAKKWNLKRIDESKITIFVLPTLVLVGVIARLILFVYNNRPIVITDGTFYQSAMIFATNEKIEFLANGLENLYILVLHGLFFLLGNNPLVGVVFDICLYFCTLVMMLFSIRRLCGGLTATITIALLGFLPHMTQLIFTMTPGVFGLFLFAACLSFISKLMESYRLGEEDAVGTYLYSVFAGFMVGLGIYLDLRMAVLLFLLPGVLFLKDNKDCRKSLCVLTLLEYLGAVCGFVLGLWGGGYYFQNGLNFANSFLQYKSQYTYDKEWLIPSYEITANSYISLVILGFMMLSVWSFLFEKRNRITIHCFGFLLLFAAEIFLLNLTPMEGVLTFYFALLASLGFTGMLIPFGAVYEEENSVKQEEEGKENAEKEPLIKNIEEIEAEEAEEEANPVTVINPIDEKKEEKIAPGMPLPNPLPVPKKRERKGMDYAKEVKEEDLHFDVEISDEDDFDIQL